MKTGLKYLFLFVGVMILVPMDLAVASGLNSTIAACTNKIIIGVLYMSLLCLLDVPSVAISFVKPRLGSLMILSSAGLSLPITALLFMSGGPQLRKYAVLIIAFYGLKFFVGSGIRYAATDGLL